MSRRVAAGLGVLFACLYLIGALVSGHLDPLDRRPILDGLAPPPAYGWVSPPPALAPTNKPPSPKTFPLSQHDASWDPVTGSLAGVFATGNYQATLALGDGALPPTSGADGAVVTMTPIAPTSDLSLPDGYQIAGNIVHITASYRPQGGQISHLDADASVTLAYPIVFGIDNTLIVSDDGSRWTTVRSTDHVGQQLVVGAIRSLGYFAVGQKPVTGGSAPGNTPSAGSTPILPIAVLLGGMVTAVVVIVAVRSRHKDEQPHRPPPPPRREDPFDPWRE